MRLRFQDMECTMYNESNKEFSLWEPPTLEEIKKEDELKKKQKVEKNKTVEVDIETERLVDELGLRSLKEQSRDSDVEQIDLSLLDYDAVDVENSISGSPAPTSSQWPDTSSDPQSWCLATGYW